MASFRFPQSSLRSQSCHPSPARDSDNQFPSSLSPQGDTGTHGPAPPMTPFQTQESGPPDSLPPGAWTLVIHGSVFADTRSPTTPCPPFLSQNSVMQNPSFLPSVALDCLAPGFPAPAFSKPEHQALWIFYQSQVLHTKVYRGLRGVTSSSGRGAC